VNIRLSDITKEPRHEQAAAWFMALHDEEVSDETIQGWQQWMVVDANRRAYDEIERLWHRAGDLAPMPVLAPAIEHDPVYDGSTTVRVYTRAHRPHPKKKTARLADYLALYGVAAVFTAIGVAVLLVLSFYRHGDPRPVAMSVYETAIAQHQDIVLTDGSHVQLGARSSITTSVNVDERTVVLDRGEAAFKVAHDPGRPFRVLAGGGMITAVGTAFNVRRLDGLVVVTVTEGTVQIEPAEATGANGGVKFPNGRVTRGQEIIYGGAGNATVIRKADLDVVMSWHEGRLQYRSEPLYRVIQDVNRYSRRSITVADAAAGEMLYSGTVFERDIDDWLAALDTLFPEVQVASSDAQHVIIRSKPAESR
jgi:transmembrane sensor